MMQELGRITAVEGAPSVWINERNEYGVYDTYISTFDKSNAHARPEREEGALVAYEQAIELAPREAILYYHKGQVLEQLGRAVEAESAYEEARSLGHTGQREEDMMKTPDRL